jgi:hypothetical protein
VTRPGNANCNVSRFIDWKKYAPCPPNSATKRCYRARYFLIGRWRVRACDWGARGRAEVKSLLTLCVRVHPLDMSLCVHVHLPHMIRHHQLIGYLSALVIKSKVEREFGHAAVLTRETNAFAFEPLVESGKAAGAEPLKTLAMLAQMLEVPCAPSAQCLWVATDGFQAVPPLTRSSLCQLSHMQLVCYSHSLTATHSRC